MRIYLHSKVSGDVAVSQAASPPLAVAVLAALCVGLSLCGASEPPGPRCDNGKLSLDRDMPADAGYWTCASSTWPESAQTLPSIDTVHDPEPARQICMDEPISYHHSIPTSGAFRPVKPESGEYLYCPPQRWLNNLHHGAIVLLHHPCAPLRERHLLSGLARSCLPGYILTSHPQLSRHMPVALASWGRSLELPTAASSDICDWLHTIKSRRIKASDEAETMNYNLLLMRSAGLRSLEHSMKKDSLRRCCEETISSLLRGTGESEPRMKRKHLVGRKKGSKNREKRAAIRETDRKIGQTDNTSKALDLSTNQTNRTTLQKQTIQPNIQKQNQNLSSWTMINMLSNVSKSSPNVDSAGLKSKTEKLAVHTEAPRPAYKESELRRPVPSAGTRDAVNGRQNSSSDEFTDSVRPKDVDPAKRSRMKEIEVVDVEEREVEHKLKHSATHTRHKDGNTGFDSTSKTQSKSRPQPNPQPAAHTHSNCDGCSAAVASAVNRGLPRTPRSDEAVWAAAALGFLLVLLTLSVLHTRLYRYWRTAPSLYWHDPRQDYDSVADVIRRRLRIAKRRRKRGRRQECVLLPSSSSSDEHL